jgi:hypothetical protein
MVAAAPKTIEETRSRMQQAVRDFRARAAGAGAAERGRLADQARRAIGRLRKQFKHKIDDMLRRDAKRHWGLNEGERLGLAEQLRLAAEGALERLEQAVQDLGSEGSAEPEDPEDLPHE